ncbi:Na+/H+ antiporter subunit D [Actinotalea caeni]|uniref:Na+/H+ antiporter subunit D n=1 Tax=Actinotalea caeni TaxID=1348467 RepID=UPI0012E1E0D3|nr:Na+/H+ antiporter subunit D [Actinotalea caeni]
MTWLVPLPVVIPLVAAGLALALGGRSKLQSIISAVAITLVLLAAGALMLVAHTQGPQVVNVGEWSAPVGISLVGDRLSALMLFVSAIVLLCVLLYSLAQGLADGNEGAPIAIYHPTYLVLAAGVANAFLSGDLFNLYVGFEILLGASFVLLTLGGTGERIRAGSIYVVVSLLSSVLFLVAIAFVYTTTGTLNLAQLAERIDRIDPGMALVLQVMLLLGFLIKAAVFPLSAWLPDSYPTAPAPVTAVFAGLLTKVGVYAIIRTQTLLFPSGRLDDILLVAAIVTMLVGIVGAVAQDDLKRLLSFTLVSHIGYMVFGVALANKAGLSAAIFYVAHHITVQTALFLVAGLIERRGGTTSLEKLGSLGRLTPALAVLFFVPAMNLAGIPPMSGFLGKIGLLQAGAELGTPLAYAGVAAGLLTSLLTLYAIVKAWNRAFWQEAPEPLPDTTVPRTMFGPAAVLAAVGVAFAVVAGPLGSYTDSAAADLQSRNPYIASVLVDGERGDGSSDEAVGDQPADAGGDDDG